jgi:hypothetical protein
MQFLIPPYTCRSKSIRDYCMNSTNEYIKKITQRYNLERNDKLIKINNPLNDDKNDKPERKFDKLIIFLSISTIGLYLYRRLKD